jgi:protein-tyrosine-phosphatase
MPVILFVCTANQFRSPIAVACLRRELENRADVYDWTIESAGTWTKNGSPPPKMVLQAGARLGLDGLDQHRSHQVDQNILTNADLVLVMETGHKEALISEFPYEKHKIYLLTEVVKNKSYDVPDPAFPEVDADEVAAEIQSLISEGREKILSLAQRLSFIQ